MSVRQAIAISFFLLYVLLAHLGFYKIKPVWVLVLLMPFHLFYWHHIRQRRHAILRIAASGKYVLARAATG